MKFKLLYNSLIINLMDEKVIILFKYSFIVVQSLSCGVT